MALHGLCIFYPPSSEKYFINGSYSVHRQYKVMKDEHMLFVETKKPVMYPGVR